MSADLEKHRVLIAAEPALGASLAQLFHDGKVDGWQAHEADGLAQARFCLQHQPFDALVILGPSGTWNQSEGLVWLTQQREVPVVLLAEKGLGAVASALENGAAQWLPLDLARDNPSLLGAALRQAARLTDLRRKGQRLGISLQQARRQIDRLVGLLWRTLPGDAESRWLTQRHMMERLHEEVGRSERYGDPLTIVLGEVQTSPGDDGDALNTWMTSRVERTKRRCDVAGQYGPHGFILLLVHTPEEGGAVCCRRLQNALGQPGMPSEGVGTSVQSFFGMASYTSTASTPQRLLGLAEHELETAKQASESIGAAV
jgi:diguanylate cyclase (GGDEF)-like protein